MSIRQSLISLTALILFILAMAAASWAGGDPFSADSPPELPDAPPPVIPAKTGKSADVSECTVLTIGLPGGWSVMSFPLAHVKRVKGLSRMLFHYIEGSYYPIDPVNDPEQVNTRWGYLAYCDEPSTIEVTGVPNRNEIRSVVLAGGWNLLGCPSEKAIPWQNLSVSYRQVTAKLSDVASPSNREGSRNLLLSRGYTFDGKFSRHELLEEGAVLQPMSGEWVFAWHPLTLVMMGRKNTAGSPWIEALTPSSVPAGSGLVIEGSAFGAQPGMVTIAGVPVKDEYLLSWSDTRIEARVPSYCMSGDVIVFSGRNSSNSKPLKIEAPLSDTPPLSTLMGKVQAPDGTPLSQALVILDNGLATSSGEDGSFVISRVISGEHAIHCSLVGYREAQGKVHLPPGGTDAVNITLSPVNGAPDAPAPGTSSPSGGGASAGAPPPQKSSAEPKKGILHVVADAYDDGYHRWWVRKIEVTEWGNSNYYWYNDWYSDLGDAWYALDCPGVRVGKTYIIKVCWLSRDGGESLYNSWYRTVYSTHQTETIDSPGTLVH